MRLGMSDRGNTWSTVAQGSIARSCDAPVTHMHGSTCTAEEKSSDRASKSRLRERRPLSLLESSNPTKADTERT